MYHWLIVFTFFGKLNKLSLSLQVRGKTIISFIDALLAFQAKLEHWERNMTMGKTGMFLTLNEFLEDAKDVRLDDNVKSKIITTFNLFPVSVPSISPT